MASMSTNYHLDVTDKVRVEVLWGDGPDDDDGVTVRFGEYPYHLTVFFRDWQHVADVASKMLGAASIALDEQVKRANVARAVEGLKADYRYRDGQLTKVEP